MNRRNILTGEGAEQLNQALQGIKSSLDGLIDITAELVPEKIFTAGIPVYFQELCKILEIKKRMYIDFSSQGEFQQMNDDQLVKTYKTLDALVNYLSNQSNATEIKIVVAYDFNEVKINGTYFGNEMDCQSNNDLKNLESRISLLNAKFNIQPMDTGDKTAIEIHFEVN